MPAWVEVKPNPLTRSVTVGIVAIRRAIVSVVASAGHSWHLGDRIRFKTAQVYHRRNQSGAGIEIETNNIHAGIISARNIKRDDELIAATRICHIRHVEIAGTQGP